MADNEYEIIAHTGGNFRLFLVNLLYRTPHIHKDFEISTVLSGQVSMATPSGEVTVSERDFFVMNPFQSHELTAQEPALILSLQISPAFFSAYYPQIAQVDFDILHLCAGKDGEDCAALRQFLFALSRSYFRREEHSAIRCAIFINRIFLYLLETQPYHLTSERELLASQRKGRRMRKIMQYIDSHFPEKLLLSDIARQEGLDLYYLSHFFKDTFGITFQQYLSKTRCEHARQLVLRTNYSLLDISLACGFSDPKYFNRAFCDQYGCTPKEYRRRFQDLRPEQQQISMLTTQEFLSDEDSLRVLETYADE